MSVLMKIFKNGAEVKRLTIEDHSTTRLPYLKGIDYDYYELDDRMRVKNGFEEDGPQRGDKSLIEYLKEF